MQPFLQPYEHSQLRGAENEMVGDVLIHGLFCWIREHMAIAHVEDHDRDLPREWGLTSTHRAGGRQAWSILPQAEVAVAVVHKHTVLGRTRKRTVHVRSLRRQRDNDLLGGRV